MFGIALTKMTSEFESISQVQKVMIEATTKQGELVAMLVAEVIDARQRPLDDIWTEMDGIEATSWEEILLHNNTHNAERGVYALVDCIMVKDSFRQQGLATQLIDALIAQFKLTHLYAQLFMQQDQFSYIDFDVPYDPMWHSTDAPFIRNQRLIQLGVKENESQMESALVIHIFHERLGFDHIDDVNDELGLFSLDLTE